MLFDGLLYQRERILPVNALYPMHSNALKCIERVYVQPSYRSG